MRKIINLISILVILIGISTQDPIEVNESNWEDLLSSGEWMVEFFAPWCPACNRFESTWKEFSHKSKEFNIKVGSADVNSNPVLSGLFSVTSLPTIYHIKDGNYRIYNGNRELANLVDFIKNKEWQKVEPTSSWLSPNSFLIKSLSLLFKLTIYFKDIYTDLTEVKGYPMWAVLTLFVVITISLGLLLGIVFILIIDLLCPPKRPAIEEHKEIPEDLVDTDDNDISREKTDQKAVEAQQDTKKDAKSKRKVKKDQ